MLETIREYAAERLAVRDETTRINERLAAAMIVLAEQAAPKLSGSDR